MRTWILIAIIVTLLLGGCTARTPLLDNNQYVQPTPIPQVQYQQPIAPAKQAPIQQEVNVNICCDETTTGSGQRTDAYSPQTGNGNKVSINCPSPISGTATVAANCVVLGDVTYGNSILYDEGGKNQGTVVVVLGQSINITAQWGAGVEKLAIGRSHSSIARHYADQELAQGCSGVGCQEARIVIIDNGRIVFDQRYR